MTTPAADGLTMPPEWAPHERTLMGWPCRRELWGEQLGAARREQAGVANAVAEFEPVTMIVGSPQEAAEARAALSDAVEIVELPIDDSWLRDTGPIYVVDDVGRPARRAGVHFGFNAWGGKFQGWDRDAAVGGLLLERTGELVYRAPLVLEGGSVIVDGTGTLVTTEQCLLNANRNAGLGREAIEQHLREYLGVQRIVWLGQGLVEDRDTDGHVDLIATFPEPGRLLLQSAEPGSPNHERMAANRERALAAGLDVTDFPLLAYDTVEGVEVAVSYLNLYVGEQFVIVPLAGQPDIDGEAVARLQSEFPGREVVGVPGLILAYGGGGPHCITQQVPALASDSSFAARA
jgi:agmatine deiminase